MLTLEHPSQFKPLNIQNVHCTIGVFDGVHLGHQKLINNMVQTARSSGGKSVVITFDRHPFNIINPSLHIPCLTLPEYKMQMFESLGVDVCIMIKFDKAIASTLAEAWIMEVLWKQLHISAIYLSEDSFFGKDQKGNINLLYEWGRRLGFKAVKVESFRVEKTQVSSTVIRNLVTDGNLGLAEKFLGRPYSVFGIHIKGTGRGKEMGFPTINLNTLDQCLPPNGIYTVWADKNLPAVSDLGINPTFGATNKKPVLEIFLLTEKMPANPDKIEVTFIEKLRNEIKFPSVDKLMEQIKKDVRQAKDYFSLPNI